MTHPAYCRHEHVRPMRFMGPILVCPDCGAIHPPKEKTMSTPQPRCCYIYPALGQTPGDQATPCQKTAEWEIWDSPDPYTNTQACSDHVGHLLTDAPEHRVYPLQATGQEQAHG